MTKETTTEVEVVEEKKAKAPILGGKGGLQLVTLDDYWRFAEFVVSAKVSPSGMENTAAVVIGLQSGAELGLAPMQSLQNIAVINGRPSIWGDAAKALVETSGLCEEFDEWFEGEPFKDGFKAICEVRRVGRKKPVRWEFSVEDAKRAQLWGKKSKTGTPSPWVLYPKRMLQMRARGFACRDAFPDVLKGLRLAEESRDIEPAIDVTPAEVGDPPKSLEDLKEEMGNKENESLPEKVPYWESMCCQTCGVFSDQDTFGAFITVEGDFYCPACITKDADALELTDEEKRAIVEAEDAEHAEKEKKA